MRRHLLGNPGGNVLFLNGWPQEETLVIHLDRIWPCERPVSVIVAFYHLLESRQGYTGRRVKLKEVPAEEARVISDACPAHMPRVSFSKCELSLLFSAGNILTNGKTI